MAHGLSTYWTRADVLQLVLLVFLADPVWGAIWRLFIRSGMRWLNTESAEPGQAPALPYAQPNSPAARMLAWLGAHGLAATRRDGILHALPPLLLLAGILAIGLGPMALIATLITLLGSTLAVAFAPNTQAWLQTALQIGLPWSLTLFLWNRLQAWPLLLLGVFAMLLHYAGLSWLREHGEARFWALLGMAAIVTLLAWQRQPIAAAGVTICWLVPLWATVTMWRLQTPLALRLGRTTQGWWLVGILVSALALTA